MAPRPATIMDPIPQPMAQARFDNHACISWSGRRGRSKTRRLRLNSSMPVSRRFRLLLDSHGFRNTGRKPDRTPCRKDRASRSPELVLTQTCLCRWPRANTRDPSRRSTARNANSQTRFTALQLRRCWTFLPKHRRFSRQRVSLLQRLTTSRRHHSSQKASNVMRYASEENCLDPEGLR